MSQNDEDRTILAAHVGGAGSDERTVIAGAAGAQVPNDGRTVIADHGPGAPTGAPPGAAPAAPPVGASLGHNALSVGMKLGEFEITGLIGEGGFGIVYLAYDHSLERQVAMKEYMPSELASRTGESTVVVRSNRHADTFAAGMRSFINEAKLLAQFDHPSLVKVYRFWEQNGTAYMVMPFYEGITLKTALKDLGHPPDETWLKSQLAQLLDALEIIHNRQCYHRDIAPDNIMILPDETPLLLDFGAARRVIGDMTQALTVILKPGYAPIEQYAEVPNMRQGPWTDLYALASVVYYAIEGKAPVPAVARVMSDPLVPLAQAAAGRYSDSFLRAIDKALSVKPDDRPQSIAELRQLLGFVERAPTTRYLPAGVERRATEDRIESSPTMAAPTVAAPTRIAPPLDEPTRAAPARTAVATPAPAPAPAPARKEPAAARSKMPLIIGGVVAALLLAIGAFVYFVLMDDTTPQTATATKGGTTAKAEAPATASAADVNAKLAGFDCAQLVGAVNGGTVLVEGHVSREADLQRINTELSSIPGVTSVNRSAVKVVPPPHCQVASALAQYMTDPANGPTVSLKNGATQAFEGQKLVTSLAAAGFAGYIYADLYDTEGNVVHMLPNPKERSNKVEPGAKMLIGDDALFGMQWDLVPPFGKHMLVVMQSQTPLFLPKTRPEVEKVPAYLAALKEDIGKMRPGDKFVASYSLFDFTAKK